jgi:hypothetical protein
MKKLLMAALILFMSVSTFAFDKGPVLYDGYYVDRLIWNTRVLFVEKHFLQPDSGVAIEWQKYQADAKQQEDEEFLPAFPFMDFENSFLSHCVKKNLITYKQANAAIEKCQHVGGSTINGYNVLYLHAAILEDLVLNKHIMKAEAQHVFYASYGKQNK